MNLETCLQMLIKVNKREDSEFDIFKSHAYETFENIKFACHEK